MDDQLYMCTQGELKRLDEYLVINLTCGEKSSCTLRSGLGSTGECYRFRMEGTGGRDSARVFRCTAPDFRSRFEAPSLTRWHQGRQEIRYGNIF